ncbi:hypothetical protein F2P81_010718 [Scophthalmus maximus]|uniref:Uncharacterized protein n=1 Tax=Scophthalmus maximus TaxID=52904 RepID=A0A6A4T3P5_SCOMX|nr:hypothetical protein F2P81_010718 [Scophthalmus maximus]
MPPAESAQVQTRLTAALLRVVSITILQREARLKSPDLRSLSAVAELHDIMSPTLPEAELCAAFCPPTD